MCRKLVSLVLVLGLVSVVYAKGDLIASWENPPELDGWSVYTANGGSGTLTSGIEDRGVTDGVYSLKVQTPESWWCEFAYVDLVALGATDSFFDNDTFTIDISRYVDEWTDRGYWWGADHEIALLLNPGNKLEGHNVNWWNLGWQGLWGWNKAPMSWGLESGDQTLTLSWYYGDLKKWMDQSSTEFKLILVDHYMNASANAFYLDNARFIPEPATIALLGLGGLALIRRKR